MGLKEKQMGRRGLDSFVQDKKRGACPCEHNPLAKLAYFQKVVSCSGIKIFNSPLTTVTSWNSKAINHALRQRYRSI
jgi:hypothetical protein